MGHTPYPRSTRAAKYAVLHGRRVVTMFRVPLGAFTGDWPPHEAQRLRNLLDALPRATMTFTAWFGEDP